MMKLVSRHLIVVQEMTFHYEYDNINDFNQHKETMKDKGAFISHRSTNGKIFATYIQRKEDVYDEHF